jgi:hypothetical protein
MNVPLTAIIAYGVAATLFGLAIWRRLRWLTWKRGTLGGRPKELAS